MKSPRHVRSGLRAIVLGGLLPAWASAQEAPPLEAPSLSTPGVTSAVAPASVPSAAIASADPAVPALDPLPEYDPARAATETPQGVRAASEGPLHEAFLSPAKDRDPIYADKAPPSPISERPGVDPPSENAVWIPGYWEWNLRTKDYTWATGTYRVPPPGRFWVNGYWKRDDKGWYRVVGFWSDRQTDRIDWRKDGPPTTQPNDDVPNSPGADYFYIPGHYAPDGDGVTWKKGYWSKTQPGWSWVPAQWLHQPEGWAYQEGYWDRTLEDRGTLFAPATGAVNNSGASSGNSEATYAPLAQVAPQQYGQLYGAFGRPNSSYDGYPGCYYDSTGRYYGYAGYGSIGSYYGYLDYPYNGGIGYPYYAQPLAHGNYGSGLYGGFGGYGNALGGFGGYGLGTTYVSGLFGSGYPYYGLNYGGFGGGGLGYGYPFGGFGYGFGGYGLGFGGLGYGLGGFGGLGYGGLGGFGGYPFGGFGLGFGGLGLGLAFSNFGYGYGYPYGGYGYGGYGYNRGFRQGFNQGFRDGRHTVYANQPGGVHHLAGVGTGVGNRVGNVVGNRNSFNTTNRVSNNTVINRSLSNGIGNAAGHRGVAAPASSHPYANPFNRSANGNGLASRGVGTDNRFRGTNFNGVHSGASHSVARPSFASTAGTQNLRNGVAGNNVHQAGGINQAGGLGNLNHTAGIGGLNHANNAANFARPGVAGGNTNGFAAHAGNPAGAAHQFATPRAGTTGGNYGNFAAPHVGGGNYGSAPHHALPGGLGAAGVGAGNFGGAHYGGNGFAGGYAGGAPHYGAGAGQIGSFGGGHVGSYGGHVGGYGGHAGGFSGGHIGGYGGGHTGGGFSVGHAGGGGGHGGGHH